MEGNKALIPSLFFSQRAARNICHPDEESNESGWKDLGQRGERAAGSGFGLPDPVGVLKGPLRDYETGTGFAGAKLSRGQKPSPAARDAPVVRMTNESR
jgi:hypothetical protein